MNWFSTSPYYCPVKGVGLYFHSSAGSATTLSASLRRVERDDPFSSCISLAFRTRYPIMRFRNIFAADCVWCNEPCADSCSAVILRHAWLSPWNKHMTTGRINQISIVFTIFNKKNWKIQYERPFKLVFQKQVFNLAFGVFFLYFVLSRSGPFLKGALVLPIAKKRALTSIETVWKKHPDQQEESRKTRFASRAPKEWLYSTKTVFCRGHLGRNSLNYADSFF